MRLHRLRVRAFGPFADETVIDFDELSADGLFLLHGQTGAGKTTILDAVAFALYGRVPGARQDAKRLPSDHAGPEAVPEVELEATVRGRRLRITRSPEFQRPSKRGGATLTTTKARASLVWLDGSGVDLSRIPEIGDAIIDLMGMSAEQFFQVVLLPQGDFARFLRANPDERESLLERVFETDRFGDLEDWLRDAARSSGETLAERAASLDGLARQIVAVGGAEPPAEPDLDWAQACLADGRAAADVAHQRLTVARDRLEMARDALARGQRSAELRERGSLARTRLAQLDARAAELCTAQSLLDDARRAQSIAPVAEDHDDAVAALAAARRAREAATALLAALPEGAALGEQPSDAGIAAAISGWTAESGRLEPLALRVAERPDRCAEIDTLAAQIDCANMRIAELDKDLSAAPGRRGQADLDVRHATEAAAALPGLRAERARIDDLTLALGERPTIVDELAQADQARTEAREHYNTAHEHLLDVRERRIAGMAAELAGRLADGAPCVVCGSADHPNPAVGEGSSVSDADEVRAQKAERAAAGVRDRAGDTCAAIGNRLAAVDARLGGASADAIDRSRRANLDALTATEHAAAQLDSRRRRLEAIDAEVEAWQRELTDRRSAQSASGERIRRLRVELAELDAEIEQVTGGRFTVGERRAELAKLCRIAEQVRQARGDETRAVTRQRQVADKLVELCAQAGFADVGVARAAVAPAERIAEWENLLTQATQIRAASDETLRDEEVAAVLRTEPVDVPGLAAAVETAAAECDAAAGDHGARAQAVTVLERFVTQFGEEFEALEPVRARHAELHGLAELVSGRGQNNRRMSLRSYVLAARLSEVLVVASDRLRQMSSGRYEFVHSDAAGPRGRRGGLGIEVRDEYTGKTRATTTLSGGETFFASLALALGLADVVSAESGGRVLDTIFIDEGFGTLDPEALDLVMGVLDELRSGGRVVGVVSHVDELRARIPAQVHVLRGENGSRVQVLGTVGAG